MLKEIIETDKSAALYVKDYMIIMGYLFLEVSFQNANRAGEARNMTYKEFLEGKVMEDNSLLINVSLHKVNYKYGSSPVVISPSLHTELRTYVEKIRPEPRKNCNNFFLSSVGGEISTSSMPRIMKNYWEKTGLSGEVNASLLRKASVTYVKRNRPSLAAALALKMLHKESTQQKYYHVEEKSQNAIRVSAQLKELTSWFQEHSLKVGKDSNSSPKVTNDKGSDEPSTSQDSQRDHQDPTGVNSAPLDQDASSISSSAGNQESAKALLSSESSDPPHRTGSYWQTSHW